MVVCFVIEYTSNCSRNLEMPSDRATLALALPRLFESQSSQRATLAPAGSPAKSRQESPRAQPQPKLSSGAISFLQCCAFPLPSPAPVDNPIPVKMSPTNTPAAMAATSQDIEMLLAAQVRATAHFVNFFD